MQATSLIVRGSFILTLAGLLSGLPLSLAAGRILSSQINGLSSWDSTASSLAVLMLAGCGFVAALIPAVRAASLSPCDALRIE